MLILLTVITPVSAFAEPDVTSWSSHPSPGGNAWADITYGNGTFVAVAEDGDGQRVMTSVNGVDWILRTPLADAMSWKSITFGNGLFVAVAYTGTGSRVMTSPDGITWTGETASAPMYWWSITFGNGLFVAVSNGSTGNQVMTSPDGADWTGRAASRADYWTAVTYGGGLFVALSESDKVMTSPDGINWTNGTTPGLGEIWSDITYGGGKFIAVGYNGGVMRSADGITWIDAGMPGNKLVSVAYGDGYFVALGQDVTFVPRFETVGGAVLPIDPPDLGQEQTPQIFTSADGRSWRHQISPQDSNWSSIAFGNGRFVAVSSFGYGDRTMRSAVIAVANPTPDPAAVEAARLAEERAVIAEAVRLRQLEIDNFRKLLFAKLVRGERPTLIEYNNAVFNQVTARRVELVTDRALALDVAKRSDFEAIDSIANDVAYWDTFFNPLFRPTLAEYALNGISGVTERTLKVVNEKVLALPMSKQKGQTSIQEIATLENFVDRIANPATRSAISSTLLISKGLLAADSPYKYTVVNGLAGYPEENLNNLAKIEAAIAAELKKAGARKAKTAEIKAKIAARKL